MGKKNCCNESKAGEIPSWFMTYSDVITLMMTFFILLLTFSTNEPEFFSKVQVVAFGGGGSTGMAGEAETMVDNDVPIARHRPASARMTMKGSETPPMETNPATQTLAGGLETLKETNLLADADRIRIQTPMSLMRDENGQPTGHAQAQAKLLAGQLRKMPVALDLRVTTEKDAEYCIKFALAMTDQFDVPLGRISVATVDRSVIPHGQMEMLLTRQDKNSHR